MHSSARVMMFTFALMAPALRAQAPCTKAQALATEGRWDVKPDATYNADVPLLRRQYPTLAATTDRAIAVLQQAVPSPRGLNVRVHRSVNAGTLTGAGHVHYEVNASLFGWYCVPATGYAPEFAGKVRLSDEASGDITIWFNSSGSLKNERRRMGDLHTPDGQQIFYPMKQLDSLRGEALYELNVFSPFVDRVMVLTVDGANLWRPVTRDELLGARITYSQARVDSARSGLLKLRAVPDTSRVMPVARRTLRLLESDVQTLVSARSALSPEERDQPAVVVNPFAPPATLFVSAANGGTTLVVFKGGVLKRGRPRTEVGMITIEWSWSPYHPEHVEFMRQFTERLDIAALRGLLTPP
jgi:hypothetical protein